MLPPENCSCYQKWNVLYGVSCAVIAILFFLFGFFPLKVSETTIATWEHIPTSVANESIDVSKEYGPVIDRLVLIIIDAFRWDFIAGHKGHIDMPYSTGLIQNNKACLLRAQAHSPTVTMPRIKALTTGTVPNFIDLVLNLGSKEIVEDNIIKQAEHNGMKLIFYGDDTWLKLFPSSFSRSDGVTSFYVPDFTEVDDNVTRHLDSELNLSDWHIMILHYLGLDHIGHLEGPGSIHVHPKLNEMDDIVKRIHMNTSGTPPLIIVTGDHGMKDEGSHGGSSLPEVTVPFITIGLDCDHKVNSLSKTMREDQVLQIDIVPTLSVLLGLPIPVGNLGKIIVDMIHNLSPDKQLFSLYYNAKQMASLYEKSVTSKHCEHYARYQKAVELHVEWKRNKSNCELFNQVFNLYTSSLRGMSSLLTDSLVNFDMPVLITSSVLMIQAVFILLGSNMSGNIGQIKMKATVLLLITLLVNISYCLFTDCNSILCKSSLTAVIIIVSIFGLICVNGILIVCYALNQKEMLTVDLQLTVEHFLILGTVLHTLSYASSSFIEEEHQVWNFLWGTFTLLTVVKLFKLKLYPQMIGWVLVLFIHRVLRDLNHTGDKWAFIPDIGDWLTLQENKAYLTAVFILGLVGVCYSCCYLNINASKVNILLFVFTSLCIYCYHAAVDNVILPFVKYPQSRGVTEVHVFWTILLLLVLKMAWEDWYSSEPQLFYVSTICWIFSSALLHRPHNVLLLTFQLYCSKQIHNIYKYDTFQYNSIAHFWLGMVFYFYQGNSNSIASVNLTAGYVGLSGYCMFRVALQLFINTFSSTVFSYLLALCGRSRCVDRQQCLHVPNQMIAVNRAVSSTRVIPCSLYLILMIFQRHHLFVWSVFSPKLLYEAMHLLTVWSLVFFSTMMSCINHHSCEYHTSLKLFENSNKKKYMKKL